jgi:hypothetical protein
LIKEDATIIRTVLFGNESGIRHFNQNGIPIYGKPDGWGIMQLDPPSNENCIWSWKVCMEESALRVKGFIDGMYVHYGTQLKKKPMSRWQWRMNIYRAYNGHYFWTLQNGKWKWTEYDKYAYCLRAIRTEKQKFGIKVDQGYEDLTDQLRRYAKNNWKQWYGKKEEFPAYLNKF